MYDDGTHLGFHRDLRIKFEPVQGLCNAISQGLSMSPLYFYLPSVQDGGKINLFFHNVSIKCKKYSYLLEDNTKLSGRSKKPQYFLNIFTVSNV